MFYLFIIVVTYSFARACAFTLSDNDNNRIGTNLDQTRLEYRVDRKITFLFLILK